MIDTTTALIFRYRDLPLSGLMRDKMIDSALSWPCHHCLFGQVG